jgi:hypothetical protein
MVVKPGNYPKKNRKPSELFQKENLKANIWTCEREWEVMDQI